MNRNNMCSLKEVLNEIIDSGAVAITADTEAANRGQMVLTIHPYIGLENAAVADIDEVLVEDIPSRLILEQTHYGIDLLGRTIVYLQEDMDVKLNDGSRVSGKSLDDGLNELKDHVLDFACERANEQKQRLLDDTRTDVDTSLLYEISLSQNPTEVFSNPQEDTNIEIYTIDGHEYALYTDGGIREAYKCSRVSETLSEQLRESDYWKTNLPQPNQASAEA
jgi:hypothetical protein